MTSKPYHRQYKVCLIGDGFVGKTSIRRRYLGKVFKTDYIATIGVDFAQKSVTFDATSVLLVIWDIAGQPLYQGLRKRYYDGCSGIVLVYSVIDRSSFDNASKWLVEAHGFMRWLPPIIIIGNKTDLRSTRPADQTVTSEEGEAFAAKFSERLNTPTVFVETSAMTGENIDEAFGKLTKLMIDSSARRSVGHVAAPAARVIEPRVVTPVLAESAAQSSTPTPVSPALSAATRSTDAAQAASPEVSPPAPALATATEPSTGTSPALEDLTTRQTERGFVSTTSEPVVVRPPSGEPAAGGSVSPSEAVASVPPAPLSTGIPEIDAMLSSLIDPSHLQDDVMMQVVAELGRLRLEMKRAESDLAILNSKLDTDLLNLRNVIQVKRVMYETLQQQVQSIKQQWSEVYDEYQRTEQHKRNETAAIDRQISEIRKRLQKGRENLERRVQELERAAKKTDSPRSV